MDNKSVLVIGDVAIDVFFTPKSGEASCQMKEQEKYLCFSYGDKIPVEKLQFFTGGNAANVAIGLRRLEIPSAIYTTIGSDSVGRIIFEHLEKELVDMKRAVIQTSTASNYSTIISYQGERTIFTYHAPRTYTYIKEPFTSSHIYLTSMGEKFMPFYKDLINDLKTYPNIVLMFNPGSLQSRASSEDIKFILSRTNILFVNRKEAEIFSGIDNSEHKEKMLLQTLSSLGPKEIIITDGEHGVYTYDGTSYMQSTVIPVTVIEKTGAGDSFNAGFIAARLNNLSFETAIRWGTMNAASVIGYVGAQNGLLTKKDIDAWTRIAEKANLTIKPL